MSDPTHDYAWCDDCGKEIGSTGWIVPTGETDDELQVPIVKLYCQECHTGPTTRDTT